MQVQFLYNLESIIYINVVITKRWTLWGPLIPEGNKITTVIPTLAEKCIFI